MTNSNLDPKIVDKIKLLAEKYEVMGQDLLSYLDGLLYADYLTYWDYIHLDTLLSLQKPKTPFKDEVIFIIYHQITELYFKLIIHEIEQIQEADLTEALYIERLKRLNRYLKHLESSFTVMVDGMDKEQFLKYRMSLLPASGFQSAQYRFIELMVTDINNLLAPDQKEALSQVDLDEKVMNMYWKRGATELATGKKTLTLKQFEGKYHKEFVEIAENSMDKNLWYLYQNNFSNSENKEEIIKLLREFDMLANIYWRLAHYKSAVRYLQKAPEDIAATGGTNWQKYLPPRFQQVIFFPELWSEEEKAEWGKTWVVNEILNA